MKKPNTSLIELKEIVVKGPNKRKKKKTTVKQYDVFESTSESDQMASPPMYKTPINKRKVEYPTEIKSSRVS